MINIILDLDQTLISAEVLQEDEDDIDDAAIVAEMVGVFNVVKLVCAP